MPTEDYTPDLSGTDTAPMTPSDRQYQDGQPLGQDNGTVPDDITGADTTNLVADDDDLDDDLDDDNLNDDLGADIPDATIDESIDQLDDEVGVNDADIDGDDADGPDGDNPNDLGEGA